MKCDTLIKPASDAMMFVGTCVSLSMRSAMSKRQSRSQRWGDVP